MTNYYKIMQNFLKKKFTTKKRGKLLGILQLFVEQWAGFFNIQIKSYIDKTASAEMRYSNSSSVIRLFSKT